MATKTGRPTKLTKQVKDAILLAVTAGNFLTVAAAYAGIAETTLYKWIERGEAGEQPFKEFAESLKKARANAEVQSVALIRKAANGGTWQAAAWYLERSAHNRWGRQRIELTTPADEPIHITHSVEVDMEALETKVQMLIAKQTKKAVTPTRIKSLGKATK